MAFGLDKNTTEKDVAMVELAWSDYIIAMVICIRQATVRYVYMYTAQ